MQRTGIRILQLVAGFVFASSALAQSSSDLINNQATTRDLTQGAGIAQLAAPTGMSALTLQRGVDLLNVGKPLQAIDMLAVTLNANPDSIVALNALGNAYLATGHEDLAAASIEVFERVIGLDAKNRHALEGAARTAWSFGDHDKALTHMEALYRGGGKIEDSYAGELAMYYMLANQLDRGLRVFAEALPRSKQRHATMLLIASMLMQKKEKPTARAFVDKVLSETPPGSRFHQQATEMLEQGVDG